MGKREKACKHYCQMLCLCIGMLMMLPLHAAEDFRIQEELNAPAMQTPLRSALGEEAYNEAMASGEYHYVGNTKCRLCHRKFFLGRKNDHHDFAMEPLREKGYEDNPKCLKCHSTGFGVDTGFVSMKETPRLANVQCEGCHGPGNQHVDHAKQQLRLGNAKGAGGGFLAGADRPERLKKMCKSCHTDRWDRSYNDFESAYLKYRNAEPK